MDEKEKISLRVFKIFARYLKGESLSIVLCIVFKIAMYVPTILIPYLWGQALEALTKGDAIRFAKLMIIHTSVYILVHSLISFISNKLYVRLEIKFVENVSKDMYNKISDLPARAFEEIGVGEFVNRLSEDSDTAIFLLSRLIDMVCKLIVTAIVLTICISTSWILGIEILIFAIVMGFISAKFFPKIQKRQKDIRKENDKLVKISTENITGIREIKALGITSKMKKRIADILDELYRHSREIRDDENAYYSINNLVYFILQGVILLTSGFLFLQETLTYSLFIMIETYIWRIDDVVESLSDFGAKYNKVKVSLNRIDEILADRLYSPVQFGETELRDIEGIIEFKNVYFRYREEEKDTLKGLTLRMEPHKKIAIIGRSGNGKSTIFNLLLRYFDASEGTISIDGENIVDLTEDSLRSNVSIIRQNPFLFNVSIFENFKMLKDDITLEEVREVCKRAYIDEYIMSLKEKYDTLIGEGGINLSGGQKQRLAIARTLLLNTKIILFDEATSALDNESEEYIKKTIDELVGEHTIIIVAHRLSTIVDADVIHVIDKGTLVGSGTHEELLANNEVYKSLYKKEIR